MVKSGISGGSKNTPCYPFVIRVYFFFFLFLKLYAINIQSQKVQGKGKCYFHIANTRHEPCDTINDL